MPAWAEWDWSHVSPNIKSWCAVIEVSPYPLDFIYRFSGEGRSRLLGNDYSGQSVLDIKPAVMSNKILQEYATVVERRAPTSMTEEVAALTRERDALRAALLAQSTPEPQPRS
mgnify:CR=1 FL=1